MASEVEICNRALQKLGAKRITSLSEDSVNARACNVAIEPVRLAALRAHPWNFAIARASLAADATAPDWGRGASFQLPSGFLRILPDYPEDEFDTKDWQIEGQKILTDETAPLYIRYIQDISDPNLMDPIFREYYSTRLAFELCEQITQSNEKKAGLKDDMKDIVLEAKKTNAMENRPVDAPDSSWIYRRA